MGSRVIPLGGRLVGGGGGGGKKEGGGTEIEVEWRKGKENKGRRSRMSSVREWKGREKETYHSNAWMVAPAGMK